MATSRPVTRGDERAGNARRHRGQARRTRRRHAAERVHHAPDRAEQTEERRAADRRRQDGHAVFQPQRLFADFAFQRRADRVHRDGRDRVGLGHARGKGVVEFRGAEEMKGQLLAAGEIDQIGGRAWISLAALINGERLAGGAEAAKKWAVSTRARRIMTNFVTMTDQLNIEPRSRMRMTNLPATLECRTRRRFRHRQSS